jgi:hypothetical protein
MRSNFRIGWVFAGALICHPETCRAENPLQQNTVVFRNSGLQAQRYAFPREAGSVKVNGLIMNATATSTRWVTVHFRTMAEPPLPGPGAFGGGILRDQNTVHRLLFDKNSQSYFGYDLAILSGDGSTGYRVAFQPLGNTIDMLSRFAAGLRLQSMPPATYPAPESLRQGETIALDVMVSPNGRQKIVDYLQLSPPEPVDLPPASSTVEPKDFTVDETPLNLNLDSFERTSVFMDGNRFTGRVGFSDQKGGALWIVFPGQGRYVLSLASHPGFVKAGTIRDHVIAFRDGSHPFEVRLATPITGAGHAWNLYLHHDPNFQPRAANSDAVIVGTGRLESLLRAHEAKP